MLIKLGNNNLVSPKLSTLRFVNLRLLNLSLLVLYIYLDEMASFIKMGNAEEEY
jgi:hypothetical protein